MWDGTSVARLIYEIIFFIFNRHFMIMQTELLSQNEIMPR